MLDRGVSTGEVLIYGLLYHRSVLLDETIHAVIAEHLSEGLLCLGLHFGIVVIDQLTESVNKNDEFSWLSLLNCGLLSSHEFFKLFNQLDTLAPVIRAKLH